MNNLYPKYKKAKFIERVRVYWAWICSMGIIFYNFSIAAVYLLFWSSVFLLMIPTIIAVSNEGGNLSIAGASLFIWILFFSFLVIMICINIFPYYRVYKEIKKKLKEAQNLEDLKELPIEMKMLLRERISILFKNLPPKYKKKMNNHPFKFHYERRNYTATPSMVYKLGVINMIVPLGFFKVLDEDVESADAILAHELAHFFHYDSNLLLKIRCYYELDDLWDRYIPLIAFNSLVGAMLVNIPNFISWGFLISMFAIVIMIVIIGIELFIRHRIHLHIVANLYDRVLNAEKLADLFAITVTSPEALKRFLNANLVNNENWYSLHPPLNERLDYINKYAKLLE